MLFGGKKLSDISEADLNTIIDRQIQERDTLEYKRQMYGTSDDDKKEMLKDITSLANHHGGYIIIGIEENQEGTADALVGIDPGKHVERIRESCLDNIEKRIIGLDIEDIPVSNGKTAVVISVPESFNSPHMITYKGLNQFWKRHGRQKDKMTIDEIGTAFDKRLSGLNRIERFLIIRKADILENIGEQCYMVLSSLPAYLKDEIVFDVHDTALRSMILETKNYSGMGTISCGVAYPTINGLRADGHSPDAGSPIIRQYMELYSMGYIEYGKLIDRNGKESKYFAGKADTAFIVDFIGFVKDINERYLPFIPIILNLSIYNAKDMWLAQSQFRSDDMGMRWTKQHIELGNLYSDNIAADYKMMTKKICDRLWQSFHREKSNVFDDAGTFRY